MQVYGFDLWNFLHESHWYLFLETMACLQLFSWQAKFYSLDSHASQTQVHRILKVLLVEKKEAKIHHFKTLCYIKRVLEFWYIKPLALTFISALTRVFNLGMLWQLEMLDRIALFSTSMRYYRHKSSKSSPKLYTSFFRTCPG